jgi:hypothetical protein
VVRDQESRPTHARNGVLARLKTAKGAASRTQALSSPLDPKVKGVPGLVDAMSPYHSLRVNECNLIATIIVLEAPTSKRHSDLTSQDSWEIGSE